MRSRHLSRSPLCFPRTLGDAFKDATYASPLTRPYPPLWKRIVQAVKEIISA